MDTYLQNAEQLIEQGNIDEAEIQINRASLLLNDYKDNVPVIIKYKVCLRIRAPVNLWEFRQSMPVFLIVVVNSLKLLSATTNSVRDHSWMPRTEKQFCSSL
jgi:hypothetical protein